MIASKCAAAKSFPVQYDLLADAKQLITQELKVQIINIQGV